MKGTRSSGWNAIFAEHSPGSSGPDNEKKKEGRAGEEGRAPRAFWQASACSVRVMHAVCAESWWKKKPAEKRKGRGKSGWREREREREKERGISVGGETGWKYCSRINTSLPGEKEGKGKKKKITAVKRARRLGIIVSD